MRRLEITTIDCILYMYSMSTRIRLSGIFTAKSCKIVALRFIYGAKLKQSELNQPMTNLDAVERLDRHIKENTANGNMHPGENWYEKDYREAEDIIWAFTDLNFHSLKKIFEERSQVWQEACVFVLGESSTTGSIKMLSDIFIEGGGKIACYAAVFLSGENLSGLPEEEKTKISSRLGELLEDEKYKQFGDHYQISLEKIRERLE